MVQTRDGERLASEVYLPAVKSAPAGQQRWPAVLIRTPYGKRRGVEVYYRFVQRGYAVVIQDVRGREDSTGEWMPQHYEIEDGDDTLNWIAAQPWSDGTVGIPIWAMSSGRLPAAERGVCALSLLPVKAGIAMCTIPKIRPSISWRCRKMSWRYQRIIPVWSGGGYACLHHRAIYKVLCYHR